MTEVNMRCVSGGTSFNNEAEEMALRVVRRTHSLI